MLSLPGEACAELGNVTFVSSDLLLCTVHLQAGSHNARYFGYFAVGSFAI